MIKRPKLVFTVLAQLIILMLVGAYCCYNKSVTERYINDKDVDEVRVSVIVPVYNSAKYLLPCLKSLFEQTLRGVEFIFVDDNSTDDSIAVIEDYVRVHKVPRSVRVLRNTENPGPGPSRNIGIEAARGKYVGFIDPDDYISANYYERLYAAAEKQKGAPYDVTKGIMVKVEGTSRRWLKHKPIRVIGRSMHVYEQFYCQHITGLFRRGLLIEHPDARYGTSKIGEDILFLLITGFYANNITFVNDAIYFYKIRKNSLSWIDKSEFYADHLISIKDMANFCLKQVKNNSKKRVSNEYISLTLKSIEKEIKAMEKVHKKTGTNIFHDTLQGYTDFMDQMHSYLNGTLKYN